MHRPRRLWTGAQNAGCDLEPVVQRNPLVQQERCCAFVALRSLRAPASLLPADEWRACLFHGASLADRRRARHVRGIRHALVSASVLTLLTNEVDREALNCRTRDSIFLSTLQRKYRSRGMSTGTFGPIPNLRATGAAAASAAATPNLRREPDP